MQNRIDERSAGNKHVFLKKHFVNNFDTVIKEHYKTNVIMK